VQYLFDFAPKWSAWRARAKELMKQHQNETALRPLAHCRNLARVGRAE
jgi:hypothetical protein